MPTLSSQKLIQFYENYGTKEIAFSKSIIDASGLETKKVFLKIRGEQFPCVVYSSSLKLARIIINLDNTTFEEIKKAKNFVSLRLSFFPKEVKSPVVFFVPSLVKGYNTFNTKDKNTSTDKNNSTFLMTIEFSQKPPDDLIEILGRILELAENFEKRKTLRITLEGKVIEDIGLATNKAIMIIDNLKRPCILRNISASGCMAILSCNPKFIMNKKVFVLANFKGNKEPLSFEGVVMRAEEVVERKDLYGIGILFAEDKIPYKFKETLNAYLDKLEEMMKKKT